jgi:hypothetical protein
MHQLIRNLARAASGPNACNGHERAVHFPPCLTWYPVTSKKFKPGAGGVDSFPMISGSIYQWSSFLPSRSFD